MGGLHSPGRYIRKEPIPGDNPLTRQAVQDKVGPLTPNPFVKKHIPVLNKIRVYIVITLGLSVPARAQLMVINCIVLLLSWLKMASSRPAGHSETIFPLSFRPIWLP